MSRRQIAAWAGMIAPSLFVLTFMIEGWLRPGYNPFEMFVSALSLGSRGWVQVLNFMVFGILLFIFSRGVAAEFPDGKASRGGLVILTIIAACYFLSGPFVMDPPNTPVKQVTFHGTMHGIFGAIVFMLMPTCCFVYLRRFRDDPDWHFLQWWTLALGIISALGVILLTAATKSPATQSIFNHWQGLIQRIAIVPFMVWVFVFALGLLRRSKTD